MDQSQVSKAVQSSEREIVIYAKIDNMEGLKEATRIEKHEQAEGEFGTGQRCRVRVVETLDSEKKETAVKCYLTIKHKSEDHDDKVASCTETTVEIDKAFALAFTRAGATRLSSKTRYVFMSESITMTNESGTHSIPDIVYEVDVYNKTDGTGTAEWCKIDIEIDSIENFVEKTIPDSTDVNFKIKISHLPFKPVQAILIHKASEEEKDFVGQLYETQFIKKINQSEQDDVSDTDKEELDEMKEDDDVNEDVVEEDKDASVDDSDQDNDNDDG